MAKGKRHDGSLYAMDIENMTAKQLRKFVQTYGKRAVSRMRNLAKAYGPGGSLEGRKSYVLEKFEGKISGSTKGLSEKALALKAQNIKDFLAAKSSTVKGVKEIDDERFRTFKEKHPNFKISKIGKNGRTYYRKPNKEEWEKAMQLMGKIQAAEKGGAYDSHAQLFMAYALATGENFGVVPDGQDDSLTESNFLNESGDMLIHSDEFFAAVPLSEQLNFMPVEESPFD